MCYKVIQISQRLLAAYQVTSNYTHCYAVSDSLQGWFLKTGMGGVHHHIAKLANGLVCQCACTVHFK